ncbi:hypothetical protein SLEP1_g41178 [Rubroshorea leprosula]|uniref:Uncharacterized protein n=1 Tax=Rubroshorea leprosula TaxID=152421 RepID=A0AAV5L650_9ROSI|nr:hypothetical protein SLEP1_g41178 [Rubroshorea leprosula]
MQVALEKDNKMKGNSPERLVSGSDDFTMFLWKRADDNNPKLMTGCRQKVIFSYPFTHPTHHD